MNLAANQYLFNFNPNIANGGTLSYRIVPGSSQFTNPLAIPTNSFVSGSLLSLTGGGPIEAGTGPKINSTFPGTRVVKMRLATTYPSFSPVQLNLAFRTALPNPFTKIFAYIGTTFTEITNNGTYFIDPWIIPLVTLSLRLFIEGFYNPLTKTQIGDSIRVYLRVWGSPYTKVDSAKSVVSSTGTSSLTFYNATPGFYYIVVKHRNSIETWSINGPTHLHYGNPLLRRRKL